MLLKHGAKVSAVNGDDKSCLDLAIENHREDIATILIEHN